MIHVAQLTILPDLAGVMALRARFLTYRIEITFEVMWITLSERISISRIFVDLVTRATARFRISQVNPRGVQQINMGTMRIKGERSAGGIIELPLNIDPAVTVV